MCYICNIIAKSAYLYAFYFGILLIVIIHYQNNIYFKVFFRQFAFNCRFIGRISHDILKDKNNKR